MCLIYNVKFVWKQPTTTKLVSSKRVPLNHIKWPVFRKADEIRDKFIASKLLLTILISKWLAGSVSVRLLLMPLDAVVYIHMTYENFQINFSGSFSPNAKKVPNKIMFSLSLNFRPTSCLHFDCCRQFYICSFYFDCFCCHCDIFQPITSLTHAYMYGSMFFFCCVTAC